MDAGGAQLDEAPTDRPSTHTNFAPTRIASPMSHESSSTSPAAFRRVLTDKLRALAVTSRWTVHQLRRQMAYDRLLERLYLVDDDWIVKGATALLARNLGVRATIDVDVFRAVTQEVAEADLREAARRDIGDWFRFDVGPARPVSDGAAGTRFPVTAFLNGLRGTCPCPSQAPESRHRSIDCGGSHHDGRCSGSIGRNEIALDPRPEAGASSKSSVRCGGSLPVDPGTQWQRSRWICGIRVHLRGVSVDGGI